MEQACYNAPMRSKEDIQKDIEEIESAMNSASFWDDKEKAQETIQQYQELKDELEGVGKYDKKDAIMTIFAGAGGDDAEDFARMLLDMYKKYIEKQGWTIALTHENQNEQGGYRNATIEISGKGVYGALKNESGVHRLVRLSPFNAKSQRHTSFAMVEVIPKFEKAHEIDIPEGDLEVSFARSSGPGGQNVNKRETAVRMTHIPTGLTVHVETERNQERNREKAQEMLEGKLYAFQEQQRKAKEKGMYVSKTTDIEWGNQIRSYVLHPYQMVKDHRTDVEIRSTSKVLEDGDIQEFIDAEKML